MTKAQVAINAVDSTQRGGDQRGRSTQRYDQDRHGDQALSQGQDQREDGRSRSRSIHRQYDNEQRYSGLSSAGSHFRSTASDK